MFCYSVQSVISSFAIILIGKRELDALLLYIATVSVLWLSSRCRGLIVVFPDHNHLLFVYKLIPLLPLHMCGEQIVTLASHNLSRATFILLSRLLLLIYPPILQAQ